MDITVLWDRLARVLGYEAGGTRLQWAVLERLDRWRNGAEVRGEPAHDPVPECWQRLLPVVRRSVYLAAALQAEQEDEEEYRPCSVPWLLRQLGLPPRDQVPCPSRPVDHLMVTLNELVGEDPIRYEMDDPMYDAVVQEPGNRVVRLVMADRLEESGSTELAEMYRRHAACL